MTDQDRGASPRRPTRRSGPQVGSHPGGMAAAAIPRRRITKAYGGRLPVSGQEPPRITRDERERDTRRKDTR